MTFWQKFYDDRTPRMGRYDYLKQVGHTVAGIPIPQDHVVALQQQIVHLLDLQPDDVLLDLCCGNGLFTAKLARHVSRVTGVDISSALLEIAGSDHTAHNIIYEQGDALDLAENPPAGQPFNKLLQFAALQHFQHEQLNDLLTSMLRLASPRPLILLGFIPDLELQDRFYDTPERRAAYRARLEDGSDTFGTWWSRTSVAQAAHRHALDCQCFSLPDGLHAARYRFHALLAPAGQTYPPPDEPL